MDDDGRPLPVRRPAGTGPGGGRRPATLEDLVVPVIPSLITSITLDAVTELSGGAKLAVAAALAIVLWWLVRDRRGTPDRARGPGLARRDWRRGLLVLGALVVLALLVTILVFHRPTLLTAGLAVAAFALAAVPAARGSWFPGALAAAIAGGVAGLCLGIALL